MDGSLGGSGGSAGRSGETDRGAGSGAGRAASIGAEENPSLLRQVRELWPY